MKERLAGVSTVCESCSGWRSITSGERRSSRKPSSSASKARSASESSKSIRPECRRAALAARALQQQEEGRVAALHEQQRPAVATARERAREARDVGDRAAIRLEDQVAAHEA